MTRLKIGLVVLVVALLPLIVILLNWQFGHRPDSLGLTQSSSSAIQGSGRVGDSREATLDTLTQLYIARKEGVTAPVQSGKELAPVDFLNQELKRKGEKWRVREIDGLSANTYDIS